MSYEHHTPGDIIGEIHSLIDSIDMDAPKPDTVVAPLEFDAQLDKWLDALANDLQLPLDLLLGREPYIPNPDKDALLRELVRRV